MSEDKSGTKAKLILSLKSDIADVQASIEDHKQAIDKLTKKFTQVTPVIDNVRDACNTELAKLRDELTDESQILMKVVTWIRDKLDAKIDKKLETAQESWLGSVKKDNEETAVKMREEFSTSFEEGKVGWDERIKTLEREYAVHVSSLKDEFAHQVSSLKEQWHHERTMLEGKIESLEKEHKEYLQSKISGLHADAQAWAATEAEKASSEKSQQIEEKLGVWRGEQDKKMTSEFTRHSEEFRTLWKADLDLLRKEEALVWERERRGLRDEEKQYRESLKAGVLEELSRFQKEALELISTAQEELARSRSNAPAFEEQGERPDDDEIFAIGKQLSEKQTRREKEKQTKQILISPDSILKKLGDEEHQIEGEQQKRDAEIRRQQEKRDKV